LRNSIRSRPNPQPPQPRRRVPARHASVRGHEL
jgi:hypothetical protein